jgi:hypothetical protein
MSDWAQKYSLKLVWWQRPSSPLPSGEGAVQTTKRVEIPRENMNIAGKKHKHHRQKHEYYRK